MRLAGRRTDLIKVNTRSPAAPGQNVPGQSKQLQQASDQATWLQRGNGVATSILVQGNVSATWLGNLMLAGALAVVCLGIAITMAALGYWLILPFAGLEVVFFTACLYWTLKKLSRREVITIDDDSITLEWGYNKPDTSVRLPRHWSQLVYHRPRKPMDMGAVSLQAHGKRYVLGSSLGRLEKKELYSELNSILGARAS